jgi:RNA polymerase sigma-70 factor (TIGR02943 family)
MTDAAEFSSWVNLYLKDMVKWAMTKVSDKELAKDLVQETFATAFEQKDRFERKSSPKTWLLGILKNKIFDHYRKSYSRPQVSLDQNPWFENDESWKSAELPLGWNGETDGELLDQPGFREIFEQCLGKLAPHGYSVLVSRFLGKQDSQEICQELGITSTNYWQIAHRAKLQVRKCLEMNWFKS